LGVGLCCGGLCIITNKAQKQVDSFFTFCIAILAQTLYNHYNNFDDKAFAGQKSPFILVATLSLIKFFSMIDWKECAIIKFISANSMGIYLIHWSMSVYVMAQNYTTPFRYLTPILIIVVSSAICWLMNKNKITRTLIHLN
jgi:surface polysaccharide O-acyltransferase-like enzyme